MVFNRNIGQRENGHRTADPSRTGVWSQRPVGDIGKELITTGKEIIDILAKTRIPDRNYLIAINNLITYYTEFALLDELEELRRLLTGLPAIDGVSRREYTQYGVGIISAGYQLEKQSKSDKAPHED